MQKILCKLNINLKTNQRQLTTKALNFNKITQVYYKIFVTLNVTSISEFYVFQKQQLLRLHSIYQHVFLKKNRIYLFEQFLPQTYLKNFYTYTTFSNSLKKYKWFFSTKLTFLKRFWFRFFIKFFKKSKFNLIFSFEEFTLSKKTILLTLSSLKPIIGLTAVSIHKYYLYSIICNTVSLWIKYYYFYHMCAYLNLFSLLKLKRKFKIKL